MYGENIRAYFYSQLELGVWREGHYFNHISIASTDDLSALIGVSTVVTFSAILFQSG